MRTNKSEELFERSKKRIPGGVNSPVRAFGNVGGVPRFIARAEGDRIFDVDGNEYIDYVMSWGPMILGHSREQVLEAVEKACREGLTFGAPTEKELVLADLISEAMPSMEKVRLVSSGTEATMSAIRLARGYTKKDYIIKFRGNYHGHSDGLLVKAGSGAMTTAVPDSAGVPKGYAETTLVAEYNDEESVRALMDEYKGKVACVIVEPVAANMGVILPKEGFLQFLRKITEENDCLLIFDEVITGFRLSYGGAQEYYGIKPDLTTIGKIVGGGMPLAAYGGAAKIMDHISPAGDVYQAGTLSGNPVATAAGIETLKLLRDNKEGYAELEKKASKIREAFEESGRKRGRRIIVNQAGSLLSAFHCGENTSECISNYDDVCTCDLDFFSSDFHALLDAGIYMAPSQFEAVFLSMAHTDEDIERTCRIIESL